MIVIFDVDGTLIQGEQADCDAFSAAILEVTGFRPTPEFWASLDEVTSESIVRGILTDRSPRMAESLTRQIASVFDAMLEQRLRSDSGLFAPRPGVRLLLEKIRDIGNLDTALATGEWREPILRKLAASGLELNGWPLATSSDRSRRHEIIELAAKLAGRDYRDAVYVGDGYWDFLAAGRLGIPFIGVGARAEMLRSRGAEYVIDPIETNEFLNTLRRIDEERRKR